jgi:hypothetical protein
MAFIDIYNASQDASFQGRCLVAAWGVAQHVRADDAGYDLSVSSKNYAVKLLRQHVVITKEQLAIQILRNGDIAANPSGALDDTLDWQTKNVWSELIDIG